MREYPRIPGCAGHVPHGAAAGQPATRPAGHRAAPDRDGLANLAAGTERPSDLIEAINAQATDGRRIGWKVLNDTLRRLERSGYVARQEMPGVPRETRYWLRPPGHRLLAALRLLDTWYDEHEPGDDSPGASSGEQTAGNRNDSSGATRTPRSPAA